MNDTALLARRAMARASEIRATRYRLVTAQIKRLLRHMKHYEVVDALCHYMQLDELEMIVVDIKAKERNARALAEKNRHRQAS